MTNYEQLYNNFVSYPKSLLIAPAGYGKTHTIAQCIKYTTGRQLILTHTHAGVAALKDKLRNSNVNSHHYHIETIHSFAQKYFESFYCGNDVPEQENEKEYFPFIIQKAKILVKIEPIKDIIKSSYNGLFVDEYQDCSKNQHKFIMEIAKYLPIHIVGDPLQGIFNFNGSIVSWETDLGDFKKNTYELNEPWRWKNTNPELGNRLKEIRCKLEQKEQFNLSNFTDGIEVFQLSDSLVKEYYNEIMNLLNTEDSLLLIHPDSTNINVRQKLIKNFKNRFYLVEAIDGKDFYNLAKKLDSCNAKSIYKIIYNTINKIFNKTELKKWFNTDTLKNKRKENDKVLLLPIINYFEQIKKNISFVQIAKLLKYVKKLPKIRCYRKELFYNLCKALEQSEYQNISVYEAMKNIRNIRRRIGFKIKGKCIGTTLLTKGLEFDTVIVLDAHKFKDPKNLYVAFTRASRKLVVFTSKMVLNPYTD